MHCIEINALIQIWYFNSKSQILVQKIEQSIINNLGYIIWIHILVINQNAKHWLNMKTLIS